MSRNSDKSLRESPNILLIEDDESQSNLIRYQLGRAKPGGFQSWIAESLEEGLTALRTGEFDVVVIDLGLPDSQGLETFDAVHQAFPGVPAVVMTGNDDEALAIEAVRRGAQDYIVKNFASEHTIVRSLRYAMERKRLEDELLRSQKMQAVGSLAEGIAHEFNNLLQVIHGYTRFALEGLGPEEQRYRDLMEVDRAAERAASLTSQLLEFGRPSALKMSDVQVDRLVGDLVSMLRPLLREGVHLESELRAGSHTVLADANQVQQVLMNLCLNSRDAMPDGGTLRITSQKVVVDDTSANRHAFRNLGSYLRLSVADNGCGMAADVKERIFEPFFSTKEPRSGAGLGLAVAYGIVHQHGGVITVESEVGCGTRFDIYLPIAEMDDMPEQPSCKSDAVVVKPQLA